MRRDRVDMYRDGPRVAAFIHYQQMTPGVGCGLSLASANRQLAEAGKEVCIPALNYVRRAVSAGCVQVVARPRECPPCPQSRIA